jgi:hypothetical protein
MSAAKRQAAGWRPTSENRAITGGASSAGTSAGGQAGGLGRETSIPVGGAVMSTDGGKTSSAGAVDPCPQGGCFQSCSGLTGNEAGVGNNTDAASR